MLPLAEVPWLLLTWMSHRRLVEECDVCVGGTDAEAEEVFARARAALRLIVLHAPRLHARLRRDVKYLLFTEPSGGSYLAGLRACRIGTSTALRITPLDLAMMIVHEATHARLSNAGYEYVGVCRERIERICVEEEIAFAARVPHSTVAIEKAKASLSSQWWTAENRIEEASEQLRELGAPRWLTTAFQWVTSKRARREPR